MYTMNFLSKYRLPTKLREGNVFSRACLSVHRGEGPFLRISLVHSNQNELNQIVEKHVKRCVFRYICIAFWNLVPFSENLASLNQVPRKWN